MLHLLTLKTNISLIINFNSNFIFLFTYSSIFYNRTQKLTYIYSYLTNFTMILTIKISSHLKYCFALLLIIAIPSFLVAQKKIIKAEELDLDPILLEDYIESTGVEGDFDYNTLFEQLEVFAKKPLNINKAKRDDLNDLFFLNDVQINGLLRHRKKFGDLLALHELQTVPGFDLKTIRLIQPFITTKKGIDDFNVTIPTMMVKGKNEIFTRFKRVLDPQIGYLVDENSNSRFLGDANQYYIRYKHTYDNILSFGVTAEKDIGEEFFRGSNKNGFDFYSAHLFLKKYNKTFENIAIGDFTASFGQGLVMYAGFGRGKGADVLNIKRSSRTLNRYASVQENDFLRGAGVTVNLTPNLQTTVFGSYMQRDGNLILSDTLDLNEDDIGITSFQTSGFHRSPNEIADENSVGQFTSGLSVKYHTDTWHVALNGLYNKFDRALERRIYPYNQFYFAGDQLLNGSIDYSFIIKNFNIFGEVGMSDNGGKALTTGALIGLDRKVDLAILYRNFAKDYQSLYANPIAESNGGRNESGLYLGLELNPTLNWKIAGYFDMYEHPWLRFGIDGPSSGYDVRGRVTYKIKRKMEAYIQIKNEKKQVNAPNNETKVDYLAQNQLFQIRFDISNKLTKTVRMRSRADWGFRKDSENRYTGYVLLQDISYKPADFPVSGTARFALFNTDGFPIAFYHYENDLLNNFAIPAYFGKGMRTYLNLRWRVRKGLMLEGRYAYTFRRNETVLDLIIQDIIENIQQEGINSNNRSEIKFQAKWTF